MLARSPSRLAAMISAARSGASYLRAAAAKAPDRAAEIIAARRDGLRANMRDTLGAMKAAAESS